MSLFIRTPTVRPTLDAMGATASFVCAVHCMVVALLLGVMPTLALLAASWIEWAFLATSTAIGLFALVPGYRRHRVWMPLALFTLGIAVLATLRALLVPPSLLELTAAVTAALCLVTAHWINRGALHRCDRCDPVEQH